MARGSLLSTFTDGLCVYLSEDGATLLLLLEK